MLAQLAGVGFIAQGEQLVVLMRGKCIGGAQAVKRGASIVEAAFDPGRAPAIGWQDVEVLRGESGAPSVRLSTRARSLAEQRAAGEVLVSLAHTRNYAIAHALLLAGGKDDRGERRLQSSGESA